MQSGKYDKASGVGEVLKLFEEKVYSITPDLHGAFYDENDKVIARRVLLPLEVDEKYKTQYHNDQLKYAIKPLTNSTKLEYYSGETKLNEYGFLPELSTDYASIICKIAPEKTITHVSVVIYTAQTVEKIILSDGSVTMDTGYIPVKSTDLVTKGYADDLIEDFTALGYPLRDLSITQNGEKPLRGYCYLDNVEYDVLLFRDYYSTAKQADCTLTVKPFAIANNYNKKTTKIALITNGTTSHVAYLEDVLAGKGDYWRTVSHEDIYTSNVDEFFWKNSFELTFNLQTLQFLFEPTSPFLSLCVKIFDDEGNAKLSDELRIGLDEYIGHAEPELSFDYVKETLESYKTKYVSGKNYFPHDFEKVYDLPVAISVENKWLDYFRPLKSATVEVLNAKQELTDFSYELFPSMHVPLTNDFVFKQIVQFRVDARFLRFRAYNLKGETIYEKILELDIDSDYSDESNRVTTPAADQKTPNRDYGEKWDSEKELETWEPKLYHGEYTCNDVENSALCFAVEASDCYSHAWIDIKHDGEMYLLSQGNTGWLNCQELAKPFTIARKHEDPCKMNENYYTFGKVVYDSKVFIRIIKASRVKFNSVKLA